jgi:hypothetical protein
MTASPEVLEVDTVDQFWKWGGWVQSKVIWPVNTVKKEENVQMRKDKIKDINF